eukprot:TRINITY_DN12858_c0_g1_i1.p1 TRINITY_DN12858_c0_g1~~TRINITY_DN12858_c0_g1_i1.p1  ORF type:complete len:611 (-),score=146.25 TRINITY_DN12858_c0_g1_i1:1121-2932(-)
MATIRRNLLLDDNTVISVTSDNSVVVLFGCGHAYQHIAYSGEHARHICRFALPRYCGVLSASLNFRNRYCETPRLVEKLLSAQTRKHQTFLTIDVTRWALRAEDVARRRRSNGSIRAFSHDKYSHITVDPHGQRVQIEYLSPIVDREPTQRSTLPLIASSPASRVYSASPAQALDTTAFVTPSAVDITGLSSRRKLLYGWVSQQYSISDVPLRWQHAVALTLEIQQQELSLPNDRATTAIPASADVSFASANVLDSVPTGADGQAAAVVAELNIDDSRAFNSSLDASNSDVVTYDNDPLDLSDVLPAETMCIELPVPVEQHVCSALTDAQAETMQRLLTDSLVPKDSLVLIQQCNGVTMRFCPHTQETRAYLDEDGSELLLSADGLVATHYLPPKSSTTADNTDASLEQTAQKPQPEVSMWERDTLQSFVFVYSAKHLPEKQFTTKMTYNLQAICNRMQEMREANMVVLNDRLLKATQQQFAEKQKLSVEIVEQCDTPGVGRCMAFADGRVRIRFVDSIILEMNADASVCSFTLADGSEVKCTSQNPMDMATHVRIALEFREWALMSPAHRVFLANERARTQATIEANLESGRVYMTTAELTK